MIGPSIPAHILSSSSNSNSDNDRRSASPSSSEPLPKSSIGPSLPEEHEEDDYMPALPPDLLAARKSAPVSRPIVGPSLPPSVNQRASQDAEDDGDDEYGPVPLPSSVTVDERDGVKEFLENEERRRKQIEEASVPKAPKREEWMLVPPSSSDLLGSIDPSKLKRPRKFARSAAPARDADSSLWTETPAERQQRLADEVAGKRRRAADVDAVDAEAEDEMRKRRKHDEQVRRGVEEHTRKVRGGTLLNQHASVLKDEKKGEDEPSAIWDHSRDMALSGRLMDDKSRQKFIQDARGLGDRFGTGKSGGYL